MPVQERRLWGYYEYPYYDHDGIRYQSNITAGSIGWIVAWSFVFLLLLCSASAICHRRRRAAAKPVIIVIQNPAHNTVHDKDPKSQDHPRYANAV
jgi:hypothetical protein